MSFMTQMQAARRGALTPQMQAVAAKEGLKPEDLQALLAAGTAVIPCNRMHATLDPEGIGAGLRTKINVNLGVSSDCADFETELAKVRLSLAMGAEAVMDLSCAGDTRAFRRLLLAECPAPVGTVPVYDAVAKADSEVTRLSVDDLFDTVRAHAEDGVDFLTIHAGLTRAAAERLDKSDRIMSIVSRGGSLLYAWMKHTGKENPFYEHYDRLLDLCLEFDLTLSLGDGCRPGCLHDATDGPQVDELITLGELTRQAWSRGVQVMIEGPGHMAINEIGPNVTFQKRLCSGAPFYVLGPLVTDAAPGYDHITSAIGGAIAAAAGADFLCYVTPAEHLRLPTLDDVREGIVAAKIAAHAADIAKGLPAARRRDDDLSRARAAMDWEGTFRLALDPEKPRAYRESSKPAAEDTCTMCGKLCAVRTMKEACKPKE
jgi:phosphomethylpyrimidine synthase